MIRKTTPKANIDMLYITGGSAKWYLHLLHMRMRCIGASSCGFEVPKRLPRQIILQHCCAVKTHIKRIPQASLSTATNSRNLPREIMVIGCFIQSERLQIWEATRATQVAKRPLQNCGVCILVGSRMQKAKPPNRHQDATK